MKRDGYDKNMREQLACKSYKKIKKDPMNKVVKTVIESIKNASLDDQTK